MNIIRKLAQYPFCLVLFVVFGLNANAAIPDGINFQAYLTDSTGTPVNTSVAVTFAAYNVDVGGAPLWTQSGTIAVDQGLISETLGNPVNPFPAELFDGPVYIGIFVAGEEMLPRRELRSAPYAFKAADADLLNGVDAASLEESSDIAAVASDLAGATSDIAANQAGITALEAIGADITGVSTGPGLTGGATSGNALVSVAPGGIDISHLGANSVGTSQIVNGAIGPADIAIGGVLGSNIATNAINTTHIAPGAVQFTDIANGAINMSKMTQFDDYIFTSLTITGLTELRGALIYSGSGIIIRDDASSLRWYDDAGTTQHAAIFSNGSNNSMYDYNQGKYIFFSDADSVGIGTSITTAGYSATIPSMIVTGTAEVGLTRENTSFSIDNLVTNCYSAGNLACYTGSGTVSCPVGTRVLGGGTTGVGARYGSMSSSYPSSNTTWSCEVSYDISATRSCYAICGRLD